MDIIVALFVGGWFAYSYYKYGETKEIFYPISGFLVADLYGALMTASITAKFVLEQ